MEGGRDRLQSGSGDVFYFAVRGGDGGGGRGASSVRISHFPRTTRGEKKTSVLIGRPETFNYETNYPSGNKSHLDTAAGRNTDRLISRRWRWGLGAELYPELMGGCREGVKGHERKDGAGIMARSPLASEGWNSDGRAAELASLGLVPRSRALGNN